MLPSTPGEPSPADHPYTPSGYALPEGGCRGKQWKRRRARRRLIRTTLGLALSAIPALAGWKWHTESLAATAPGDATLGMLAGSLLMLFGVMAGLVVVLVPGRRERLHRWLPRQMKSRGARSHAVDVLQWKVERKRSRVTISCVDPRLNGTGYSDEQHARTWWHPARTVRRLRARMEQAFVEYTAAFGVEEPAFPRSPIVFGVPSADGAPRHHFTVASPFFVAINDNEVVAGWGAALAGEHEDHPLAGHLSLATGPQQRAVIRGITLAVDAAVLPDFDADGFGQRQAERFLQLYARAFTALLAGQITIDCIPRAAVFRVAGLPLRGGVDLHGSFHTRVANHLITVRADGTHATPPDPVEVRLPRSSAFGVFLDVPTRATCAEESRKKDQPGLWVVLTGIATFLQENEILPPLDPQP